MAIMQSSLRISLRDEYPEIDRGARIAFAQLRFWPPFLKQLLREKGLWEDVQQQCYFIAVLIAQREPDDLRQASRLAQRELYGFLKEYGFRRGKREKGFTRPGWNEPGGDEFGDDLPGLQTSDKEKIA